MTALFTLRLNLLLQTPAEVLAWIETLPADQQAAVSPAWVEAVRATVPGDPWRLSWRVMEQSSGTQVGGVSFKGPPDAEGMVEIAYMIEPEFQRRGYATEAAVALVQFAAASGQVRVVRAHTTSDHRASLRVLEKSGFKFVGDIIDPEDGPVCRWERQVD
jgi:ribosomal-protein-alanine N-acetyltransferase